MPAVYPKPYLVQEEGGDPANPGNWSTPCKIQVTLQLNLLAFASSLGLSITVSAENDISRVFRVSRKVSVLSVSLYHWVCLCPSIWAPVLDIWGRRWSLLPPMFCLGLFSIGTATSKTAAGVFATRFFAGVFGSAPVSNVSVALEDIWQPHVRGTGHVLLPLIGAAAAVNSELRWRWTEFIEAIIVFAVFNLTASTLPELYHPVLLNLKLDFKSLATKHFVRPLRILFTDPIVTCIALYTSAYSLLYLTLEVFPIVYLETRHYTPVPASLPFLGFFVGILFAVFINLANEPRYARLLAKAKGKPLPEGRLPLMIVGMVLFPIGLFWFGWTANPKYHWAVSAVATAFIGRGFNLIFQQCITFLVDSYGLYAASATSANTFLRGLMTAGLPLIARSTFHTLGIDPAMSIIGAVAVVAISVPVFSSFKLMMECGEVSPPRV
ncbi:MFS general substrate transporter [Lindgomyces ingoldianus]|uniref:MFS general substrate transporter n=1 Tax=Lindgomyces ingoldianus TaxID=673940 RepID=A0ACB6R0H4_9PLEO|nr:MFS general substrate transporter [Lindgomyces ingoldianus]KAF2472547.1 MFS general substrate transporter [Lindgomyces ingoldianus]